MGHMRLRHGIDHAAEAEATRLITESFALPDGSEAKSMILTPWKEKDRRNKEILVESGTPDGSMIRGSFFRTWNRDMSHLNARNGHFRNARIPKSDES